MTPEQERLLMIVAKIMLAEREHSRKPTDEREAAELRDALRPFRPAPPTYRID